MSEILGIAHLKVHPGKRAEFEAAAKKVIALVGDEPGTLQYDWHFGDDDSCIVVERYADSDALIAHVVNAGPSFPDLFAHGDLSVVHIYGELSDKAAEMTAAFPKVEHGAPTLSRS